MPKKNSFGAVLIAAGLFLSASLYFIIWMVWPDGLTTNIEFQLHDVFIVLNPFVLLAGAFAISFNLYLILVQFAKRLRVSIWNYTQVFMLLFLAGFIFYTQAILRFGMTFIGRRLDQLGDTRWSSRQGVADYVYVPGRWEKLAEHVPQLILGIIAVLVLLLLFKVIKLTKINSIKDPH
ncbi:MAG: hypothetical protein ACI9JN_001967 [Bacteroidia bacterium]|jgi:hypothetical protein